MKYKGHNAKRDENEPEIFQVLRACGLSVHPLHTPLDALVGYGGITMLAEIKTPDGAKKKRVVDNFQEWMRGYTKHQVEFLETWTGGHTVLITIDDAKQLAKRMKNISLAMREFSLKSLQFQQDNIQELSDGTATGNSRPSDINLTEKGS